MKTIRTLLLFCILSSITACSGLSRLGVTTGDKPDHAPAPPNVASEKSADAVSTVGFDFLGIKSPRWDCPAMFRSLAGIPGKYPAGAFVGNEFGSSEECLRALFAAGHLSLFRGHLAWTDHKTVPAAALIPAAKAFDALCAQFPNVKCYAGLICEHGMNAQQSAALNAQLKPYLPHIVAIVDSGMKAADPSAVRECHGPTAKCTGVSLDGQSAVDVDIEAFKTHGQLYSLIWSREFNGRLEHDTTGPRQRTNFPTQDQFNLLTRIWYPAPAPVGPPAGCSTWGFPTPPRIWKTSGENYGGCKGRDCRPVWITNPGVRTVIPRINVLAANGAPLGWLPCYGGPRGNCNDRNQWLNGKNPRYYLGNGSGQTAFQLGQQAETTAQSEQVFLQEGSNCFQVNAYRRAGVTR